MWECGSCVASFSGFSKKVKSGFFCEIFNVSALGTFVFVFLFCSLIFLKCFGPHSLPAISDLMAASLELLIFREEVGENLE